MSQYQEQDEGFGWGGVGLGALGLGAGLGLGAKFAPSIRGALGKMHGMSAGQKAGMASAAGAAGAGQAMGGGPQSGPPPEPVPGLMGLPGPPPETGPGPGSGPGPVGSPPPEGAEGAPGAQPRGFDARQLWAEVMNNPDMTKDPKKLREAGNQIAEAARQSMSPEEQAANAAQAAAQGRALLDSDPKLRKAAMDLARMKLGKNNDVPAETFREYVALLAGTGGFDNAAAAGVVKIQDIEQRGKPGASPKALSAAEQQFMQALQKAQAQAEKRQQGRSVRSAMG